MDIRNIQRENGKLSFQVAVDAETFEKAVNQAYLKAKKNISVPGFRKGKAPRMIIEGMYGAGVFYEDAVESLALEAYNAGKAEAGDRTVGDPAISTYNVAEDKSLTIDFESDLYPEVTLGEYKGLTAYKQPVEVADADVSKELENIRKRNARIVTVERAAKDGDTVNLDFEGFKDGVPFEGGKAEGFDLVLGSGSFVPGFEEQLVGLTAGEEKDIDVTFPENYKEDLAGAAVVFKIRINEVKETQLPDLDDEFAKDVSEFDTLEEYQASVKQDLETRKTTSAENDFRNLVMRKAVENMTVTVPACMVDERVNAVMQDYARNCAAQGMTVEQYFGMMGIDERTFRTYIRPNAENEIKAELLLEKVAEVESIELSDEEIESEIKAAAESYGMEAEELKNAVGTEAFARDAKLKKAAELIVAAAVATDVDESAEKEADKKAEEDTTEE